jgi:hypothetical protein
MVSFQTKIPIWVNFGVTCNKWCWLILWPFGLFYCNYENFISIWHTLRSFWYIFSRFGMLYQKIWQPWYSHDLREKHLRFGLDKKKSRRKKPRFSVGRRVSSQQRNVLRNSEGASLNNFLISLACTQKMLPSGQPCFSVTKLSDALRSLHLLYYSQLICSYDRHMYIFRHTFITLHWDQCVIYCFA